MMDKRKKVTNNGFSDRERKLKEKEDQCIGDFDDIMKKIKEVYDTLDTEDFAQSG